MTTYDIDIDPREFSITYRNRHEAELLIMGKPSCQGRFSYSMVRSILDMIFANYSTSLSFVVFDFSWRRGSDDALLWDHLNSLRHAYGIRYDEYKCCSAGKQVIFSIQFIDENRKIADILITTVSGMKNLFTLVHSIQYEPLSTLRKIPIDLIRTLRTFLY